MLGCSVFTQRVLNRNENILFFIVWLQMILDMTLFDYVCVIKPVKRVVPVQACLFVLDCADIPVVKLNPLTTPLCVHDHSGKLSLKNSICSFSLIHTHLHTNARHRGKHQKILSYLLHPKASLHLFRSHMLNNFHMSAHTLGEALNAAGLLNTICELMVRIQTKLAEHPCLCVCGVGLFTRHRVLKVDWKVDCCGYEEWKWECYRGSSAWGQLFRSMGNVVRKERRIGAGDERLYILDIVKWILLLLLLLLLPSLLCS